MDTQIGKIEKNDYSLKCPRCGTLMHFLEEVTDDMAAYFCKLCGKVRTGSWKK